MKKLLNLSNHPSKKWTSEQKDYAHRLYDGIEDLPFPNIPPDMDSKTLDSLVDKYTEKIINHNYQHIHISGEPTFVFRLVTRLKKKGIICLASTTERIVDVIDDKKVSVFKFVTFREY